MNVPHWDIQGYGVIAKGNAIWLSLISLLVRREGKMIEVRPDDMLVGEEAVAKFGLGSTGGMTAKQKEKHQNVKVVRVEDRENTAL